VTAQTPVIGGPHVHAPASVPRTMAMVLLASLPAAGFGVYLFGWPALNLLLVTITAAMLSETLGLWMAGKPVRASLFDGSAVLTAWLLALTLPPWAPWWIGALGGAFAIIIGKQVFGGIGQNLFNPAMLARVALLISFPLEMTTWAQPHPLLAAGSPDFLTGLAITFGHAPHIDGMSSATVLGHVKTAFTQGHTLSESLRGHFAPAASLLGRTNGSMGETSAVLVLLGGVLLLQQRIITWHIPLAMFAAIAALSGLFHWIDPERYGDALFHLSSGGAMLGAFFIATDPVTSPSSVRGQWIFGAGCGALTWIIRTWGGYPEGVAFAVVLMNALTPLIDHYVRPRIYGRTRAGAPIEPTAQQRETSP